jgi:hypothetical protein
MKVRVRKEEGHELALMGMAFSYKDRALEPDPWWKGQHAKAMKRAPLLAPMDGGHNKFLRQIQLWVEIEAPRCWWSEFDTYKVGTVANSESTMHTLKKRPATYADFEEGTDPYIIDVFNTILAEAEGDITKIKMNLPEGYLQRRMVTMNYDNVRNIIKQRTGHRLKQWAVFIEQITNQVKHPEYLK